MLVTACTPHRFSFPDDNAEQRNCLSAERSTPPRRGDGVLELRTYPVNINGTGVAATYGHIEAKVTLNSAHQTRGVYWTLSANRGRCCGILFVLRTGIQRP